MTTHRILWFERTDSTNTRAAELYDSDDCSEGTVIIALEQTAGRGQNNRTWLSEPGRNLTFTLCLEPGFLHPSQQFSISKTVALGVLDFVREEISKGNKGESGAVDARLKWPNDIYIGRQKAGGILIEHRIQGDTIRATFAGIGLNLNQSEFEPHLPNPVSLFQVTGRGYDPAEALGRLLGSLDRRYARLQAGAVEETDSDYDRSLIGYGEWSEYLLQGVRIRGRIRGVDEFGRLLLETENGETRCFDHGEIGFILNDPQA